MTRGVFITGTDTGVGKTQVALALMQALSDRGLRVSGYKPVAAGAEAGTEPGLLGLVNDDALALRAASTSPQAYADHNPYCFEPAIAPHIAAAEAGVAIELERLQTGYRGLAATSDVVIVEGAGGWLVPLGGGLDIERLTKLLGLPVLLVVGLRLGCLNHALLSERAIVSGGANLLGWIGSVLDPDMPRCAENVVTLNESLTAPCLGILAHHGAKSGCTGIWRAGLAGAVEALFKKESRQSCDSVEYIKES